MQWTHHRTPGGRRPHARGWQTRQTRPQDQDCRTHGGGQGHNTPNFFIHLLKSKVMKQFKVLAICVAATCILSACGGSKNATTPGNSTRGTTSSTWGTEIELNDCQLLAEESPATRAYGEGTAAKYSAAKTYAEGQARAALARAVSSYITTASEESSLYWGKYAGTTEEGNSVTDEGYKGNETALQIAEEVVENAVVIKTNQYIQPNRQYHVFVCLEYQGEPSQMAEEITRKVEQLVPDEERIKMEYQFQKFQEKINEELSRRNQK